MKSEKDREIEILQEKIKNLKIIAERACNLLNLNGGYNESYELRKEIETLTK